MSAGTVTVSSSRQSSHRVAALARAEGILLWRNRLALLNAVILPAALVGSLKSFGGLGASGAHDFGAMLLTGLTAFALLIAVYYNLVTAMVARREELVLKRLRTTPVSPALLLCAQLTLILSVAIVCGALMVVAPPLGGAPWPRNIGGFVISYLLGAWAMLGLGMVIASLFHNAKVAAGFGSFLFFVMQFFAGLWWQRPNMPNWLRDISNFTPSGAAVQALTDSSVGHWPRALYLIVLAVWGAVTSWLAVRFFSWE